jgi:hypothetical protein
MGGETVFSFEPLEGTRMSSRSIDESITSPARELAEEQLRRVLSSASFSKAPRLCSLLEHIAENSISGRFDDLTEQQIGIRVFGRAPGYNSGEDTIVRGTARLLRQRLDLYYSEEGQADAIRISIPKGGYVAHFDPFTSTHASIVVPGAENGEHLSRMPDSSSAIRWPLSALLCVVVLAVLAVTLPLAVYFMHRSPLQLALSGPQPLWQALFTPGRKTLIVPGDAGLDSYIAWEQRNVPLIEYASQSYQNRVTVSQPPSGVDVSLATRSVTPMADLRLVAELVRAPERMGVPQAENWIEIRYARDVAVADTHDNNLILIGSETFNPWVTLYQSAMDFSAHWDHTADVYTVTNRAPATGEQAVYQYTRHASQEQKAITHIALVDNTQGQGRVMIVEGTSMGTTYGAVNFLTHQHLWEPIMKAATDRSGHLRNFEVLLSGDFLHGGVSNSQVLALHLH